MENKKEPISEGLLTNIVDNFFKSLQRGVASRYIAAAEKAGVHPEVAKKMDKLKTDWEDLDKYMKKYHRK